MGMIVALVATGYAGDFSDVVLPICAAVGGHRLPRQRQKMRTEEVGAERADYLRYLSVVRDIPGPGRRAAGQLHCGPILTRRRWRQCRVTSPMGA